MFPVMTFFVVRIIFESVTTVERKTS